MGVYYNEIGEEITLEDIESSIDDLRSELEDIKSIISTPTTNYISHESRYSSVIIILLALIAGRVFNII
jgi:hypothetical protein